MDTQSLTVYREILKPDFDWDNFQDRSTLVELAQEAQFLKEIPQRILGKIALHVDINTLEKRQAFSKEIGVSYNSLKIYAWVEKRLKGLDVPETIPWTSLRDIAGTKNPQIWINKVTQEKLSVKEVRKQIKEYEDL